MFQDPFWIGFVDRVEDEKQVLCSVARRPELLIKNKTKQFEGGLRSLKPDIAE